MKWQDHVSINPAVMAGKPCIKGTRITVELILERLGDGWTDAQIVEAYPHLQPEQIRAAQAYAAAALSNDEFIFLAEQEG
ncbi:MAG: DUF433 domain-containing protein [Planctomycetes bacterium]|nr:DUF433 domain-containing protein [Planctomycetota bacterium]